MGRTSAPFWIALGLLGATLAFVRLSPRGGDGKLPAPLEAFPAALGEWREGARNGGSPPILPRTASETLFRSYEDGKGPAVALYIAYWERQRADEVAFTARHAAPGPGWSFVGEDLARIPAPSRWGPELTVTRTVYERQGEDQLVSYWFIQPGRRAVGSRYWGRAYMLWDYLTRSRSDVAMVRVATRADGRAPWAGFAVHEAFIREALPALERYFAG